MKRSIPIIAVLMLLVSIASLNTAHAQSSVVVSSCGSATYTAGKPASNTQDTAGRGCVNATFSGTISGTVTANQGTGGSSAWKVDGSAVTQPVSAASLPLPSGAATAANQTIGNGSLASIVTNTTGASTAANQTTANSTLSTIATNTTGVATAANQTTANSTLSTIATNTTNAGTPTTQPGSTTAATQATAANLNAQVVGVSADGSSATGNPVRIGGVANSTSPTYSAGQQASLIHSLNGTLVTTTCGPAGTNIANDCAITSSSGQDGLGNSNVSLLTTSWDMRWNGAAWDRNYGNLDTAALITLSSATAGTTNSSDQTNFNGRGVNVVVNITAATAMTLTVNIQVKDIASGTYVTLLSSTALVTTGTSLLQVFPGATAAANSVANSQLSRTWRVQAVVTGTSVSATVGASVIQ